MNGRYGKKRHSNIVKRSNDDAKDNFRFERTIVGWRGQRTVDLRRKR
jgi:hypothetical protein